ncbi:unnamed protein product, partial [Ectocarpus sp. 12 AP-2014]
LSVVSTVGRRPTTIRSRAVSRVRIANVVVMHARACFSVRARLRWFDPHLPDLVFAQLAHVPNPSLLAWLLLLLLLPLLWWLSLSDPRSGLSALLPHSFNFIDT